MNIIEQDKNIQVQIESFSLEDTLDCGQCFRFQKVDESAFFGVAGNRPLLVEQRENTVIFHNTTASDFESFWRDYFDLDTDYSAIKELISEDGIIHLACEHAGGIRILKQDGWEALCSFIISQNNNIPRIRGIIQRLCENFGEEIQTNVYSFPSAKKVAAYSLEDFDVLRAGFRSKYILDAAQKVASKEVDLNTIRHLPFEDAKAELMKIKGVGVKVADCTLLFGFYRLEAFPMDTWIKKAMQAFYREGFPEFAKPYGGIAQQYIFHYIRKYPDALKSHSAN